MLPIVVTVRLVGQLGKGSLETERDRIGLLYQIEDLARSRLLEQRLRVWAGLATTPWQSVATREA